MNLNKINTDIAIIGISGRFPMAKNLDQLFINLRDGKDCVTDISEDRINVTKLPKDRKYKRCGFLDDVDKFDYSFFGVTYAEAKAMSPDQRILLETVYAMIENSGYPVDLFSGSNTAVFVATGQSDYFKHASEYVPTLYTGNSPEFLAAKIGRHFNLKGNVSVIDTTCSSSLVALHSACNELILGDADLAIVAGVNLVLFPFYGNSGLDTEAPDGKSRAFSADANGMSYGEVAAAILLKPLKNALDDKDHIHSVIKSTAVNYNGNRSSSITAPDSKSQAEVLLKAWRKANINASDLSYIEAHGSGTQLGDSLEFEALNIAFKQFTTEKHICPISTIKSNLGHGRNISGLSGLIKTVISLKNRVLFPTIHFEKPNPLLDFENSSVYVNKEFLKWDIEEGKPRLAGVTTLGASGTNCHVVLEEPPCTDLTVKNYQSPTQYFIIPISAKSKDALKRNIKTLYEYIQNNEKLKIEDISYTLIEGRNHYDYRQSFIVSNIDQLQEKLSEGLKIEAYSPNIESKKIILILTDSLFLTDEVVNSFRSCYKKFNEIWEECNEIKGLTNNSLKDFAFQYSLFKMLNLLEIDVLSTGIGNIIHKVITNELTLNEGLIAAELYTPKEIEHKSERIDRLIKSIGVHTTFIDFSIRGAFYEELKVFRYKDQQIYYCGNDGSFKTNDPMLTMLNTLYLRNFNKKQFSFKIIEHSGRKIELPTYQFARVSCWIGEGIFDETKNYSKEKSTILRIKEEARNTEWKIANIISEILEIYELSLHDDFFELGGDSLKGTKVIMGIKSEFGISLDFEDIFDFPKIASLAEYIDSKLNTEMKVTLIWEEVLQIKGLKSYDNFFELGGHSLLATQIIVHLNKEFNINLSFEDIFKHTTISALTSHIESIKIQQDRSTLKNTLVPVEKKEFYSLTHAQKRMFFLSQFVEDSSAYNNIMGLRLEGNLDYDVFDKAIQSIIDSQEALRTVFKMVEGEPKQFVLEPKEATFKSNIFDIDYEEDVETLINEESKYLFDVSLFPLFRCCLYKIGDKKHICILNIHHIISDGSSIGLFLENFYKFYEQISLNGNDNVNISQFQIKDYAEWQNSEEYKKIFNKQELYWLNRYKDSPNVLSLPTDKIRPVIQSFEGETYFFNINHQFSSALKKIAIDSGSTLYMILLAIYNIFLCKLTGIEDIIVGTTVAGRRFIELQPLMGLFANTLAIRNYPYSELKFTDFLDEVKKSTLEAFDNQEYPYDNLVRKLLKDRDSSRNPLFDTMFILQNTQEARSQFSNVVTSSFSVKNKTAQFDIMLEARESQLGIDFNFNYSTAIFDETSISSFVEYFKNIIAAIVKNPQVKISDIEIITEQQRNLILEDFNNTKAEFPRLKTIHALFEDIAFFKGESEAVIFGTNSWTYNELNNASNYLAKCILEKGVHEGSFVGIMINRSFEMIVSIFAVLKARCAYVPIDPEYPVDRIAFIIEDSDLSILLTDDMTMGFPIYRDISLDVNELLNEWNYSDRIENYELCCDPDSVAYLIYTSGSTGRPKGVMIEHKNVLNFVYGISEVINFDEAKTILSLTTISFDIFVLEVILPLLKGMTVVLGSSTHQKNPNALAKIIKENQIDIIQMTPSHLKLFIVENPTFFENVKILMVGGEPLRDDLLRLIKVNFRGSIFNMYGPTETTVWSSVQNLTNTTRIDIGKPINNTNIYVLDGNNKLQPIGVVGQLCIGGEGVAKGYWNNIKLTSEKFIQDPITGVGKAYLTGDLGRWREDGNLECLGRIDNQVKLRGFRIELGEIEEQIRLLPGILESIVAVKEYEGEKYLVAYYKADKLLNSEIRNYLSGILPTYMLPSYYQKLDKIPLTPNGKIDLNQLPDPIIEMSESHQPPINKAQEKMIIIWAEVLNIDKSKIGIDDVFFELGGHSFSAIRLIYYFQEEFGVKLSMREVFEHVTIRKMSQLLSERHKDKPESIKRIENRNFYPVSAAQRRLYNQQFLQRETVAYNISDMFVVKEDINIKKICQCFQNLIDRHESLRTSFEIINEGLVQIIHDNVNFELIEIEDSSSLSPTDIFNDFIKPFDLSTFPLMRCAVFKSTQSTYFLMVDIHHIVCDGMALNILMNEFRSLYQGDELQATKLRYIDYVMTQNDSHYELSKNRYWKEKKLKEIPELNLPINKDVGLAKNEDAFLRKLVIKGETYQKIKNYITSSCCTEFMFFISLYYILISKISGNDDLDIGIDVVGRTDVELMNIVGTFTDLFPLRMNVNPKLLYKDFLNNIKQEVLEVFDNQFSNEQNKESKSSIKVHFSFPNFLFEDSELEETIFERYDVKKELKTTFELKLEIQERNEEFHAGFIFNKGLFDNDTADLIVQYYLNVLEMLLNSDLKSDVSVKVLVEN